MKTINHYQHILALIASVLVMAITSSCDDDPGVANYYTAKGDMANTYLSNRSDRFSEFIAIIQKSRMVNFDLLGTYGSYTVFAPTNTAIDQYLSGRGMTSVDELTVEDCDTIAATHIIEQSFFTTDFSDMTLPTQNMLDRYLTITCDTITGSDGNSDIAYYVNKKSMLILRDDSVENGVVHTIDRVIDAANEMLPELMRQDSTITLFYAALDATHMKDSLQLYYDENYHCSPDSFEKGTCYPTAVEYDNVMYMEKRYYAYTAFVEPDDVYAAHGIYTLDDLKAYAASIYDDMYPEDADITDLTDRRNSLNRFVSYHFLPERIIYNLLTPDNIMLTANFDRRHWDAADWYETMMPHSLMKVSYPSGSEQGRYINRRGVQNRKDSRGVKIPGARILSPNEAGSDLMAVNGIYHYITDIIDYGRQTQEVVLNERLRIDATSLSPDFMNSGARGHGVRGTGGCPQYPGQYGLKSTSSDPEVNPNTCIGFKANSVRNFKYDDVHTHLHVRNRYLDFWSYYGDEVMICGMYDVSFKLPPVPEGDYEFRIQVCLGFDNRGIIQVYLDGAPCGIPVDMRRDGNDPSIGWKSDTELGDDEAIAAYDRALHNRGWMKGPAGYGNTAADGSGSRAPNRDTRQTLRRIYTTFHTDGKTDHWVRVQQKLESDNGTFPFDYIELCPRSVYNNENYPEDKW
ncbi:MAG: fasciclin domain-containing protein [Bacteroidaceae bacterium]|nr:fasciclin domain-containing protein [Bacteroidaceae bacterium]